MKFSEFNRINIYSINIKNRKVVDKIFNKL